MPCRRMRGLVLILAMVQHRVAALFTVMPPALPHHQVPRAAQLCHTPTNELKDSLNECCSIRPLLNSLWVEHGPPTVTVLRGAALVHVVIAKKAACRASAPSTTHMTAIHHELLDAPIQKPTIHCLPHRPNRAHPASNARSIQLCMNQPSVVIQLQRGQSCHGMLHYADSPADQHLSQATAHCQGLEAWP